MTDHDERQSSRRLSPVYATARWCTVRDRVHAGIGVSVRHGLPRRAGLASMADRPQPRTSRIHATASL